MESFYKWLSYRLPRRLVYWCCLRAWLIATTGEWAQTDAVGLTVSDMLDRVCKKKKKERRW